MCAYVTSAVHFRSQSSSSCVAITAGCAEKEYIASMTSQAKQHRANYNPDWIKTNTSTRAKRDSTTPTDRHTSHDCTSIIIQSCTVSRVSKLQSQSCKEKYNSIFSKKTKNMNCNVVEGRRRAVTSPLVDADVIITWHRLD